MYDQKRRCGGYRVLHVLQSYSRAGNMRVTDLIADGGLTDCLLKNDNKVLHKNFVRLRNRPAPGDHAVLMAGHDKDT